MGRQCAFPNCSNKQKTWSSISFFKLPLHDAERCRLWLSALRIAPNISKRTIRRRCLMVCSAHFSPGDLVRHEQRTCPTPTAVPFSAPAADETARRSGDEAALPDQSKYEDACTDFKEPVAAGPQTPPSLQGRGDPVRRRKSKVPERPPTRKHRKLFSADTSGTSSSSEAMDRGDARSEDDDFPVVEDEDFEPVVADLPRPPPLGKMQKKLSNVPLPDPEQTSTSSDARLTSSSSEATADPGADTDVASPDASPSPAETACDLGEPGSFPAPGPCGQGSGCGAAAGWCVERKWVVIESRLLELYHNCSHCGAVAAT